ncbi:stealth family protein [Rhodoferax sp. PAMC 29310]|uniref:stealth family protein n=1 Tax=Rhodoferax sp. PAMC 29310 TaxID=2822760 RepID=UPI001B32E960|nr:stealth family protein [Rhodoferax sp. PAMC 29310]
MNTNGPVDIVYLWVDGSDPAWRSKRLAAQQKLDTNQRQQIAAHGDVEGRFRDNDELRYSLRALDRFFPEHGHVYIVTDGQVPAWLQAHPQLSIVDHRDLIPANALPTFDSAHIESYIHRIPGLSERYFYFNDDVFFGAPVDLADWFWDDGIYAGWSDDLAVPAGPLKKDSNALENACRLSIAWLDAHASDGLQLHYHHTYQTFAHSPRAMRKSMLFALEAIAPELFSKVRSTVFRAWDKPTIVSDFVMRWALAHGHARMRDYAHVYVATGEAPQASCMDRVIQGFGDLHFFCLNDTLDNAPADDIRLHQLKAALQGLFSDESRYEGLDGALVPHWTKGADEKIPSAQYIE